MKQAAKKQLLNAQKVAHTELLYEMAGRKRAAGGNDLTMKKGCERGHSLFRSSIRGICTSV